MPVVIVNAAVGMADRLLPESREHSVSSDPLNGQRRAFEVGLNPNWTVYNQNTRPSSMSRSVPRITYVQLMYGVLVREGGPPSVRRHSVPLSYSEPIDWLVLRGRSFTT